MPIDLIAKIAPKAGAFTGMVDAKEVLGDDNANILPDNTLSQKMKDYSDVRMNSDSDIMEFGRHHTIDDMLEIDFTLQAPTGSVTTAIEEDFEGTIVKDNATYPAGDEIETWIDETTFGTEDSNGTIVVNTGDALNGSKCGKVTVSDAQGMIAFKMRKITFDDSRVPYDQGSYEANKLYKIKFKINAKKPSSKLSLPV